MISLLQKPPEHRVVRAAYRGQALFENSYLINLNGRIYRFFDDSPLGCFAVGVISVYEWSF